MTKSSERLAAAAPGPGLGPLGHCKVPAGRLPQAAGMEQVTMHQERLLTRTVASQTDVGESGWWVGGGGGYGYPHNAIMTN